MYAIIKDRGHQYRVREGDTVRVERLGAEKGASVTFDQVLLLGGDGATKVGSPTVGGAKVTALVEDHVKGEKLIAMRRIRTNKHVVRNGHRTQYSMVKIQKIQG